MEQHIFTLQPHGSQFKIVENVPEERLAIKIRKPPLIRKEDVFESINFDDSWIEIL